MQLLSKIEKCFSPQGHVNEQTNGHEMRLKIRDIAQLSDDIKRDKSSSEHSNANKTKRERVANSPKQELDLNLEYKIEAYHKLDDDLDLKINKLDDFEHLDDNLKENKLEDFEHFDDEDFEKIEGKDDCSPLQDLDVDGDFKIKFEMEESNDKSNVIQSNRYEFRIKKEDITKLSESIINSSECDNLKTDSSKSNIKTVQKQTEYLCSTYKCEYKDQTKEGLREHMLTVHEVYKCNQCDYKATQQSHLKRHILSIHGEGTRYPSIRPPKNTV